MKRWCKILFLIVVVFSFTQVFAQSSYQSELDEKKNAISDLEEAIKKDQEKLNAVSAEKNTLNKAIQELTVTGDKLGKEVKLTENKIGKTELEIKKLEGSITEKEKKILNFRATIGAGIRTLHEDDHVPFFARVISQTSLADALRETDNRITLNKQIRAAILDLSSEQELLALDREEQVDQKEKLVDYKGEVVGQKKEVENNKKEKTTLLNATKQQEAEYQKMLQEKRRLRAQFEDELAAIEAKIKFDLDDSSYPKAKHGLLAWPTASVLITQGFGLTESSSKLYGYRTGTWKGKHAGVDFRANNDQVFAMADGEVLGSGDTDTVCPKASTGRWILIRHDNGLASTYFHLSQPLVKKGARVKAGDLIAYSGNTGYSTAPHLHVGVMPAAAVSIQTWASAGCPGKNYTTPVVANSAYLNPLDYLPKAGAELFKYSANAE